MIQFNLLPDVKLEFMRTQRTKRLVIAASSLATVVALAVVTLLAVSVFIVQKKHINDLSTDIKTYTNDLGATDNINRILTVQHQLDSLGALHDQKNDATRILPIIQQITPSDIGIGNLDIDFDATTMTITGATIEGGSINQVASVNRYVDTLKFTSFTSGETTSKAFSEVVLSSLGRSEEATDYSITLKFDPSIFSNLNSVVLTVPSQVTTRSETEKPGEFFNASGNAEEN